MILQNKYHLYILRCKGNKLYTGIAKDVSARFELHKSGKAAKFTQRNKPIKIVYTETLPSLSKARKRENEINKLAKSKKEILISGKVDGA